MLNAVFAGSIKVACHALKLEAHALVMLDHQLVRFARSDRNPAKPAKHPLEAFLGPWGKARGFRINRQACRVLAFNHQEQRALDVAFRVNKTDGHVFWNERQLHALGVPSRNLIVASVNDH